MEKAPLENREQLKALVDRFYARVRQDPLIGPVFDEQAKVDWDEHLPKILRFWESLLFGTADYDGRPFPPHLALNLRREHFQRWLELFFLTVDEGYDGLRAEEIKARALNIGHNFLSRIEAFRAVNG